MTEHDIQNAVRLKLSELGFAVFRINSGKFKLADGRWFDVRNGKICFIEVKSEKGKASSDQLNFLAVMREKYGCISGIVRSVDDAVKLVGGAK